MLEPYHLKKILIVVDWTRGESRPTVKRRTRPFRKFKIINECC